MKVTDHTGKKFGDWTALEWRSNPSRWLCRCECGTERDVFTANLVRGLSKGCGCKWKERLSESHSTHRCEPAKLYGVWSAMKRRIFNRNTLDYKNYGGRGISMLQEWQDNFVAFRDWSFSSGYEEGLEIDRINVEGNYTPGNCRWVTRLVNANNKRNSVFLTINEVTKTVPEWSRIYDINVGTLRSRIKLGWPLDETLFVPGVKGRNQTWKGDTSNATI